MRPLYEAIIWCDCIIKSRNIIASRRVEGFETKAIEIRMR